MHLSTNKLYVHRLNNIALEELESRWDYADPHRPEQAPRSRCNLEERLYKVYGYKGKQVRDNIHSFDVARFIEAFLDAPQVAEVYNLGGGRANSCSIWEAFKLAEQFSGKQQIYHYLDENRNGDHICYISDLSKTHAHYPSWDINISLEDTIEQIVRSWRSRASS